MQPKISVIIPVYGVEAYLPQCVESVLAQTYDNLELLLVDDGSPDGCPALCDGYAARDGRVRVIHKKNGGLSDARNAGLDAATGDYIGFADSDDWMAPSMYETLYEALCKSGADIAACGYYNADPAKSVWTRGGADTRMVLENGDATRLLLRDKALQNYVWNKLFAARLWEGVRFPKGQKFEDINTTYRLFEKSGRAVLLPEPLYYYRMRSDGIVQSRSLANEMDCVEAGLARYEALVGKYPECEALMADSILRTIAKVWQLVWPNRKALTPARRQALARFAAFAGKHKSPDAMRNLGITGRLSLYLVPHRGGWAFYLTHLLNKIYLTKHPAPTGQGDNSCCKS